MAHDLLEEKMIFLIKEKAIQRKDQGAKIIGKEDGKEAAWLLDFRALLLTSAFLNLAAEVFWEKFKDKYPFQVGGLETVGIALVAAIVVKSVERGTPVSGFYIRKSRKHYGLQKTIEGTLTDDPIVLVDDLINSGGSFLKQIEFLKSEGKSVSDVFAFVRYRDEKYTLFGDHVALTTLFTPEDLGLKYSKSKNPIPDHAAFSARWAIRMGEPNYFYRLPKSAPVIDATKLYVGSDEGVMHALDQNTGEEIWKFKIYGFGAEGKTIFSSPLLHKNTLYFGAYDGNFYAIDTDTGKKKWIYMDADWIGSSPAIASDLGMVYVGLEYGLWNKSGGIVALDAVTGKKRWEYIEMPSLTHGSPAYSKKFNVVAIGSNNGILYVFRANDGKLLWQYQTQGEIKASAAFDEERGLIVFGSFDAKIHILNVRDGSLVFSQQTVAGIFSTPCIWKQYAYVSSLDKKIYCINLNTFEKEWEFQTAGRVFASPVVFDNTLYVGSNDGRLYEIDPYTGRNLAFLQTTERITNKIAYNTETQLFFVPTYANEIYCVEKKSQP
jgi:outer membrane protein assembly factor BamB/adenine/guanine phosphoribosyltransferase-like PRPP-binding protein